METPTHSVDVGIAPPTGCVAWIERHLVPVYDRIHDWHEGEGMRRVLAIMVIALFLVGLVTAELLQRGVFLPPQPISHFIAVEAVFSWLLVVEVASLVMGIAGSVSNAMGKQLEIFSLILLRNAFKQFREFGEPIEWVKVEPHILEVLAEMSGALALFVLLGVFYRVQPHRPITRHAAAQRSFVALKKTVALVLLGVFVLVGLADLGRWVLGMEMYPFFETFYTILIFSDVLVVLISLRYTSNYPVVFRNSGYTLITVIIRIALTAPIFLDVALGLVAGLLALAWTLAYRWFPPVSPGTVHGPESGELAMRGAT